MRAGPPAPRCGWISTIILSVALTTGCLATPSEAVAQGHGRVVGRVLLEDGSGVGGVTVTTDGTGGSDITDDRGRFALSRVQAGARTVYFVLGGRLTTEPEVVVTAGETTEIETTVEWLPAFSETMTVESASRRRERIVDAPAAVTSLTPLEIERRAPSGQLPKLLAGTPGAELTQSGLFDFNINVRGFNTLINRRVLVLIDGRDPSSPIQLGTQEWASVAFPLDELASAELVRGPVTALYGAGAFNGVLNLTTKAPRDSVGGQVRISAGELSSRRIEGRLAHSPNNRWSYKLYGGTFEGDSFARSRDQEVEYHPELLPLELIPLPLDKVKTLFGGFRVDRSLGQDSLLTFEAGTGNFEGTTALTGNGRFQSTDTRRPWARLNWNSSHWNARGYYTARDTKDIRGLNSNSMGYIDSYTLGFELQWNSTFNSGKGRLVSGASWIGQEVDTANPEGEQTILPQKQDADHQALFGQIDYDLTDTLKGVVSLRVDESTLHDTQWSPRGALVWAVAPRHTLRMSYGEAFQRSSLPEIFLRIPVAAPVDLSALEETLAPVLDGVALGFEEIPILALGNSTLDVEKVRSFEIGYNGVLGSRAFVTVAIYRNEIRDFVTGLLPQVGTSLGRLNPLYGPYRPPDELSPAGTVAVLAALDAALPPELRVFMSNDPDASPVFALLSFTNFGKVDTQGLEASVSYSLDGPWALDFNYSLFDFDIQSDSPENPLSSNTPTHQLGLGVSYLGARLDGWLQARWVDDIDWSSGLFVGPVPSYAVVSLTLGYRINDSWKLGVDISNLLDNEHYEVFGGDLLGRRALATLGFSW